MSYNVDASVLHSFILMFLFRPLKNTHRPIVYFSVLVVISVLIHDTWIKFKRLISMHITNINLLACKIHPILIENFHITER